MNGPTGEGVTKKERAKGYPYLIPPFPPQSSIAQHPHPWGIGLFFRVEALLRSPMVRAAYEEDPTHRKFLSFFKPLWDDIPQILQRLFFPPDWNESPLNGKYRSFICVDIDTPDNEQDEAFAREGCVNNYIADLAVIMKRGPSIFWPKGGEAEVVCGLKNPDPRFLYLRFDVSRPATPTLQDEDLFRLLKAGHDTYMKGTTDNFVDRFLKVTTTFLNFTAWRRNLRCYDLIQSGLTQKEIAYKIYPKTKSGTTKEYNKAIYNVKSGIRQVNAMIESAENSVCPNGQPF